jgi:hypothetical protein
MRAFTQACLSVQQTTPDHATTGETQPLHRDGKTIRRADGTLFPYRATSRFALLQRYALGEDVTPLIDEDVALGFNAQRVFSCFDRFGIGGAGGSNLGEYSPRTDPHLYRHVSALTDLAATRGMFLVWVYCADCDARPDGTGGLMPDRTTVQAHINAMDAALVGRWNVLRQGANEPFKNCEAIATYRFRRDMQPLDYGWETVDRGDRTLPFADWVGKHDHNRNDDEFPRDMRSLDELREGFSWNLTDDERAAHPEWSESFEGTHTGVAGDEPMGFDEVMQPGRRSTSSDKAREAGAAATLFGMGSCFHSTAGVAARPYGPVTRSCAAQWVFGAKFAPPEAQLAPYQRGGHGGGAGVGNMPIEHHDLDENMQPGALRSFCKLVNGREYCIRITPQGATVARDGWRIESEPYLGLVTLIR